eukprot:1228415-Rhodomonas_salina.1
MIVVCAESDGVGGAAQREQAVRDVRGAREPRPLRVVQRGVRAGRALVARGGVSVPGGRGAGGVHVRLGDVLERVQLRLLRRLRAGRLLRMVRRDGAVHAGLLLLAARRLVSGR